MTTGTFIALEFDTTEDRGAPLGDIATSLVTLNDLLRDLAALTAEPASAEFREIQVVAIEMRRPLTITLKLLGISAEAVKAFQEICRDVILAREHRSAELVSHALADGVQITEKERARLHDHILALQRAAVPLKRVVVSNAA